MRQSFFEKQAESGRGGKSAGPRLDAPLSGEVCDETITVRADETVNLGILALQVESDTSTDECPSPEHVAPSSAMTALTREPNASYQFLEVITVEEQMQDQSPLSTDAMDVADSLTSSCGSSFEGNEVHVDPCSLPEQDFLRSGLSNEQDAVRHSDAAATAAPVREQGGCSCGGLDGFWGCVGHQRYARELLLIHRELTGSVWDESCVNIVKVPSLRARVPATPSRGKGRLDARHHAAFDRGECGGVSRS